MRVWFAHRRHEEVILHADEMPQPAQHSGVHAGIIRVKRCLCSIVGQVSQTPLLVSDTEGGGGLGEGCGIPWEGEREQVELDMYFIGPLKRY